MTDHHDKYLIMKKCEILQELPKCDTVMKQANVVGKNGADRLPQFRVSTKLEFVKNSAISKTQSNELCLYT